jgi:transcriptional regulator with XRE-family HTH domain
MTDAKTTINYARLKLARRVRKITQVSLANAAETSQSLISFMEASSIDTDNQTALKIADALKVSLEWLSGKSNEGGVDFIAPDLNIARSEKDKISQRFVEVYSILKNLGVLENDYEFALKANINAGNLSNMLSGRYNIKLDLIPALAEYGANVEYIYDGRMPKLLSGANTRLKSTGDTVQRLEALLNEAISTIEQARMMLNALKV